MSSASSSGPGPRLDGMLAAATTTLLVLCVGLVAWGAVGPGPGAASADRPVVPAAAPVRLVVPSLDIEASVVPVGLSADAVLDPPADATTVGWWDDSARPGAARGQVVITGHTVHTGGGALDAVSTTPGLRGRRIDVRTRAGVQHYRVVRREVLSRDELAAGAQGLFGQDRRDDVGARLVLVTCTDWNGSSYDSNVVVVAEPV
ncbi:class F sortase [Nocardioides dongxiaopingii]|uniref:class F sortase n=1 Tax=Nocardioides dongxiaopingii TaxID=2576036 RepID=UPI001FE2EA75|nr:class F sortase [Nocardioides dongxiaopingii]